MNTLLAIQSNALILIGGGDHARVIAEAAASRPGAHLILGFVDPHECGQLTAQTGIMRLGDDAALEAYQTAYGVIALGALHQWRQRTAIAERLDQKLAGWATIVHAAAWISPTATVGPGTVVMAGAVVQTGAQVGAHCVINSGAVVEHDVVVGDNVHVAPRAAIGGGARVGNDTYIGLGAALRDHIEIGSQVVVGMGAVVTRNVPDGQTVVGVPAR